MSRRAATGLIATLILLLAALAAGVFALGRGDSPTAKRYVEEHPVSVPESVRTVLVARTMPLPSAHARRLSAMLEEGAMPAAPVKGEVLTDTDCAPDAAMVSRCRNEIRLGDGSTVVLRHPHDMRTIPCLAPGERVSLVPADV